jgi:hypothetical protein
MIWFIMDNIVLSVQTAGVSVAQSIGSNTARYNLINTFITNVWTYFLVLGLMGLSYWVYIYTQRKSASEGA